MMEDFDRLSPNDRLMRIESALIANLERFGLPSDAEVALINHSENTTFRIDSRGADPCVIRVHRAGGHSCRRIASELSWMRALNDQAGVPTPRPIPGIDGESIQIIAGPGPGGERFAVRFAWIDGEAPDERRLIDPFTRLGEITAHTHRHSKSWVPPTNFERLRWDYAGSLGGAANWGRWDIAPGLEPVARALLARVARLIRRRLEAFGRAAARFGLIHADFRLANLLVHRGDIRVIDFDDCGMGWYLYDLATALSFMELRPDLPELIAAWCAGYRRILPISAAEEAEVQSFLMMRRMVILAWTASHGETDLAKKLGAAYARDTPALAEAYLVSHG